MRRPFDLVLWDKNLNRTGWIADPISVSVTPRHLAIGTLSVTVPVDADALPALTARGARITCDYQGEQIFSGPRRTLTGQGPMLTGGTVTVTFEDDIRLLWRLLGYATPTNAAESQPDKEDRRTGAAETVLKGYVTANKSRDPRPITVATDQGRGGSIDITGMRMVPLADKLIEALDKVNVGVSVRQTSTGLLVDCYTPDPFDRSLTERGGAVTNWTWSENPISATFTVIGGPNTGTSREFKSLNNAAGAAEWGDRIEVFTDASSQTLSADILAEGQKALDAAGPTGGFSIELGETDTFHYGGSGGVHVGDLVTANVAGQDRTDVLREATLSWDRQNGFKAVPTIGERTDDPDKNLLTIIQNIYRRVRRIETR